MICDLFNCTHINKAYILTMYIGEPHSVAAITPSCKKRANPKSAGSKGQNDTFNMYSRNTITQFL